MTQPARERVALGALVAAAIGYAATILWGRTVPVPGVTSYDIYAAHYPNVLYVLRSLGAGGGLLWNPMQNCGQPFLPSTLVGLLYPPDLLFLVLPPAVGFVVVGALHLALGGIFAFLLCRQYGLGVAAATCGGLAFLLGSGCLALAAWLPTTILGPYVWLPAAMLMTERLLERPTGRRVVGLAASLTMAILPGYPQIVLFAYQVIGLRVVWALFTTRGAWRPRVLGALALGLALPGLLAAGYLWPAWEFAATSVRGGTLSAQEISPRSPGTWHMFHASAGAAMAGLVPLITLVGMALVGGCLSAPRQWRVSLFYTAIVALSVTAIFQPWLYDAYLSLPGSRRFREPTRLVWVTSFAFSVLVGVGAEAVVGARAWRGRLASLAALGIGALLFMQLAPRSASRPHVLALTAAAASVGVALVPALRSVPSLVVPVALAASLLVAGSEPFFRRLDDPALFTRYTPVFDALRARVTPQDRIYPTGQHLDYSLGYKIASVVGLPSILDYEPQTSRRYADVTVRLFSRRLDRKLNTFYFRDNTVPVSWPLFNLLAARYLVVDQRDNPLRRAPWPPTLRPLWSEGHVTVFENPEALPRAFVVPQLIIIANPAALLELLASGFHDPRRGALVEAPPPDRFVGEARPAAGDVLALEDHAESVRVRVRAEADGFLVLTDQLYPGWTATVNGVTTPILLANYAFRTVRVPAGESEVVFRYRPRSVYGGLAISAVTLIAIGLWALRAALTRRSA